MEKDKDYCALCKIAMKEIEHNLKINVSKYSHTPLILILESITGKFSILHSNICLQCYNLINELDGIEIRRLEIKNQFRKYLEYSLDTMSCPIPDELSENLVHEILDVNLLKTEDTTENISSNNLSNETSETNCEDLTDSNNEENKQILNEVSPFKKKNVKKKLQVEVLKPHKCHCTKAFRTAGELKNHMKSHNNTRAFVCEICGQSYKHRNAFNIHINMHRGINPFVCTYCNKSFTQKGALVRHVPIHTGEMPFQCDECGKRFIHHTSFNAHRLTHTGLKSYKCDLCGLALMSISHLKRHKRIHTGEKKFACSTCGKRFAEKYNLVVHEKLHDNPYSNVPQKRSYGCQICCASFQKKVKLDEHLVKEHQTVQSNLEQRCQEKLSHPAGNDSCLAVIPNV